MKTENMKLLDLQTGRYLELGTGFSYSGEWIILITFARLHNRVADAYWIEANSTNITNARYLKTEPQEPLKTLCKKTGAVVYGGRYVLLNEIEVWVYNNDLLPTHIKTGDIVLHTPRRGYDTEILVNTNDFYTKLGSNHNKITFYLKDENFDDYGFFRIQKIHGNIFEEFSKKEQGIENKFDELNNLI